MSDPEKEETGEETPESPREPGEETTLPLAGDKPPLPEGKPAKLKRPLFG